MTKVIPKATQRYADIIAAAVELMEEGGVHAVTTDRIRQRISASPTTIYNYFPNKEAILEEIFCDIHAKFYANAEYRLQFAKTADEKITTIVEGAFAEELFTKANIHCWLGSVTYHLYHHGKFSYAPEAHARAVERTRRLFLELGNKNPDASQQFWSFIDGLWLHAALGRGAFQRFKCIEWTLEFVERSLGRRLYRKETVTKS